jgi:hypothetical protein
MTTFNLLYLLLTQDHFHLEYWRFLEKSQYQQVVRPKEHWPTYSKHKGWVPVVLYPIAIRKAHFLGGSLRDCNQRIV